MGAEFFNKLQPGQRFKSVYKGEETRTLIKMTAICRTMFLKKQVEFNAIFSDNAEPYPILLCSMDLVLLA
ncbi:MAG: hypothetical protein KAV41_03055 [Candidatus Pacebacteria bacterium]|nr:hypothetical protein [Candidatus Paceibacterota bacterium]